ncbi:hypothetical protein [Fodinibius salsisoli]|uniref:Uncharacterized protein n=1 Tax=Fodinibius salsisoli TaxID=2820877 RepID=A0ABT3PND8_9BACT|nr:hypothetical protein [Fodinibius salsisoli]MCW9706929.1 hypothetical protein [Fodinibius salsisoli]
MDQLCRVNILIFAVVLLAQGCASSGGLGSSANKRIYGKDYESMKGIVRDVIQGRQLNIDSVTEAKDKQEISLIISRTKYVNDSTTSQNQGKVIIEAINDQESSVQIENPDYHFSVPEHQREAYQRLLFSQLEKYEKEEQTPSDN